MRGERHARAVMQFRAEDLRPGDVVALPVRGVNWVRVVSVASDGAALTALRAEAEVRVAASTATATDRETRETLSRALDVLSDTSMQVASGFVVVVQVALPPGHRVHESLIRVYSLDLVDVQAPR
jgi:hypothetical protein